MSLRVFDSDRFQISTTWWVYWKVPTCKIFFSYVAIWRIFWRLKFCKQDWHFELLSHQGSRIRPNHCNKMCQECVNSQFRIKHFFPKKSPRAPYGSLKLANFKCLLSSEKYVFKKNFCIFRKFPASSLYGHTTCICEKRLLMGVNWPQKLSEMAKCAFLAIFKL